jgi:hypothetical protein
MHTSCMNVPTNNDILAQGLDLTDPRHQLIYAFRRRLAILQTTANSLPQKSTFCAAEDYTCPTAETTEPQALTAGTQPEQSRNAAGTEPEYSGPSAGTDAVIPPHTAPSDSPQSADPTTSDATPHSRRTRKVTESPLDELPAETQDTILHLLNTLSLDAATLEVTAKPPYGLGIQTGRSSLYRFLQRREKIARMNRRQHDAADTAKLLAEAKSTGSLSHTATHLIALRLLETATLEDSNPSHLLALSKAIDRLSAIEHSERRLRLAEAKAKSAGKSTPSNPTEPHYG